MRCLFLPVFITNGFLVHFLMCIFYLFTRGPLMMVFPLSITMTLRLKREHGKTLLN